MPVACGLMQPNGWCSFRGHYFFPCSKAMFGDCIDREHVFALIHVYVCMWSGTVDQHLVEGKTMFCFGLLTLFGMLQHMNISYRMARWALSSGCHVVSCSQETVILLEGDWIFPIPIFPMPYLICLCWECVIGGILCAIHLFYNFHLAWKVVILLDCRSMTLSLCMCLFIWNHLRWNKLQEVKWNVSDMWVWVYWHVVAPS